MSETTLASLARIQVPDETVKVPESTLNSSADATAKAMIDAGDLYRYSKVPHEHIAIGN